MSGPGVRSVDGRRIELSNLDKVFFPDAGITKGDIVDYYERIAEVMLPHMAGRIVSMHRWPDGLDGAEFFHKDVPGYFPDWIRTVSVEAEEDTLRQLVVDDAATLVYLAQQACLTPHVWLSRADRRRRPDRMVFDFDPPGDWEAAFDDVRWAARELHGLLEDVGLEPFVMTSGSRGLHVHVPLDADADFDDVRALASDVADRLADRYPDRLTTEQRKAKRGDRIFIDVLRNAYGQTTVAPYAVRGRPGAPVATPLDWDELSRSGLSPRSYTVDNLFRRLGRKHDPWSRIDRHAASATGAAAGLREED